jgi:ComF family protein
MHLLRPLLDLLLPARCSFCRSPAGDSPVPFFCLQCWSDLAPMQGAVCPDCGRPFGSDVSLAESPGHVCRACREHPPHFDQALAAGLFEGPLREAIHIFKYRPLQALGGPLGAWMTAQVRLVMSLDRVLPVPLHRSRLRTRGFNQALLLAGAVSRQFLLALDYDNLIRTRPTRPQVELTGAERTQNVRGAFEVKRPEAVAGKRLLLVDDVFTTGATLNECSRVLKAAGAESVTAFTLARTME